MIKVSSIHNNLKTRLAYLIKIYDFNRDKPEILATKINNFKTDFYGGISTLSEDEVQYIKSNDYYYCITSRIGE